MTVWTHRYTLHPRRVLSGLAGARPREGALLRVGDGFADVHPWPELGDATLDEQLALLARGETTSLTRCSLRFAALDAAARRDGRSLFEGLTIPLSHWSGAHPPAAFDTAKVKCGRDLDVHALPEGVRLRLDFNAALTAEEFLKVPLPRVEFVEDPCPYDAAAWQRIRQERDLRLALDRGTASERVDVLVYKPAVQSQWPAFDGEIVVTSYMDHPVGQLFAAHVAATHRVSDRCGLMTHVLYEPDAFTEAVLADGARLLPPVGTGVGFDALLERLDWRRLT